MSSSFPGYLKIPANELGIGTPISVQIHGTDLSDVARHMVDEIWSLVDQARQQGRQPALILPVGPVDQYPLLADRINAEHHDWSDVVIINMDEYLADDGQWIDINHPLSFRGYVQRNFYDRIDPKWKPRPENRVFPDPNAPQAIQQIIEKIGGIIGCFGGIGINGHIAFNEPPEPQETISVEQFAALPTRVLNLSRETRTINSVTVGGEISIVPRRAITVGMKEILASKKVRLYCNRPWQRSVIRRFLHGPVTPSCPCSLLRNHPNVKLIVVDFAADMPNIGLR